MKPYNIFSLFFLLGKMDYTKPKPNQDKLLS